MQETDNADFRLSVRHPVAALASFICVASHSPRCGRYLKLNLLSAVNWL